jgi:hypothetical protein
MNIPVLPVFASAMDKREKTWEYPGFTITKLVIGNT